MLILMIGIIVRIDISLKYQEKSLELLKKERKHEE